MGTAADSVRITLDAGADLTPVEVDELAGSLRRDLLELDLDSVDRPALADLPDGAKAGAAHSAGVLLASGVISASTIKAIATVAAAWLQRSGARSITIRRGEDSLEITGASHERVETLVDQWVGRQGEEAAGLPDPENGS